MFSFSHEHFAFPLPIPHTLESFLQHVKHNPMNFINYCEIIVTKSGDIYIARHGHTETMKSLYKEMTGKCANDEMSIYDSPFEWLVENTNALPVWYDDHMHKLNLNAIEFSDEQSNVIDVLYQNGIINWNLKGGLK